MQEHKNKSFIFCGHANECPAVCPCGPECVCRQPGNMCENKAYKDITPLEPQLLANYSYDKQILERFSLIEEKVNRIEEAVAALTSSIRKLKAFGRLYR